MKVPVRRWGRDKTEIMKDALTRKKYRLWRLTVAPVVIALVIGGLLLMLWPGLFAVLFGVLMLRQSCTAEQEFAGRRQPVFESSLLCSDNRWSGLLLAPRINYMWPAVRNANVSRRCYG